MDLLGGWLHVGVSCRGRGRGEGWKKPPDFLVYSTAGEIPKSSFAPSSCLPTSHRKAVSQAEFPSFMATFTEITEKGDSDWCW